MPERIRLSRAKGWKMPPNTVKVDRSTRWGNPWSVTESVTAEMAVAYFEEMLRNAPALRQVLGYPGPAEIRAYLRGKNLACWCSGPHCHADVLLEIANA